ncbi:glycogen/starch/alpha-glucan phosphorylase, partial [Lacticaseibacillus paracasei]
MSLTKEQFITEFKDIALKLYAAPLDDLSTQQLYQALALLTRSYIGQPWAETKKRYDQEETKQVFYFSIEFLPGRLLQSNLLNLGILSEVEAGLNELGLRPQKIFDAEADPGLGNGGLGRLASAFMDAMASVGMAGNGNGIRYQYGLFKQAFVNGYQVELPDDWMRNGFAWETRKENRAVTVKFGGWVELRPSRSGNLRVIYHNTDDVLAVPYDVAMVGYHNQVVNNLRLWSAEAPINAGTDFTLEQKERINQITQILYPDDSDASGKQLRLRQEYFFTSAGIQSIVRHYRRTHNSMAGFADRVAIHINDTHPAMAIPELMRVLMDDEHVSWDEA